MSSFIHGLWTPLADKADMVARWPGYSRQDVDAAIQAATDDGTIAGYEREVGNNPYLDLAFVPYQESVAATLRYLLARAKEVWGDGFPRWNELYDEGVDDDRIKLISGARPFTPNRLVLVAIDFGANFDPIFGTISREVQAAQAAILEDFGVLANAVESPEWIRRMDSVQVPVAIAAALLFNVPGGELWSHVPGCDLWSRSPCVARRDVRLFLNGLHVRDCFNGAALPVRRVYQR